MISVFRSRAVRVGFSEEVDLSHSGLPIGLGNVTVMCHHPRLSVAEPFSDVGFGRAISEALRTEEVAEAVKATVLEADLAGARREILLKLVDDLTDEDVADSIGFQEAAARPVEDPAIGMPRHFFQHFEKLRIQRQRAVTTPLEPARRNRGASPSSSRSDQRRLASSLEHFQDHSNT
jgi:hypothetical protein